MILGAGCAEITGPEKAMETKPPETVLDLNKVTGGNAVMEEKKSELTLEGSVLGGGQVKFTWQAPEGLTEANRFIIVQGLEENPVHDNKHNWFRQYYPNRAVIWGQLSAGPTHFRICLTENNDQDTCTRYSNDVFLEVQ